MIVLNLMRIARQKGIARPVAALRSLGITYGMAAYYMKGKSKILKLSDLDKICMAWHCTPNDVLQYIQSTNNATLPPMHPMAALEYTDTPPNIPHLLMNASPEKLAEVQKLLSGE